MAPLTDSMTPTRRAPWKLILAIPLIAISVVATMLLLRGCDDKAGANVMSAKIGGKTFYLEVAADQPTRLHGLMERTKIDDDGGMVFVFPPEQVRVQGFWMKNCKTAMDIIYLDGSGRVLATHTMTVESEQQPGETLEAYEKRLPTYSSSFPSPIAIEIKPGEVRRLKVKPGDLVQIDVEGLKKKAR